MSTEPSTQRQDRLRAVSDTFDEWRRSRQKRSPIPEELWHAAMALSPAYPIHQIARVLRLNYAKLKRRIDNKAPVREETSTFIEFKADALFGSGQCSIQLRSPDGFYMEIRAEAASPSQFVPLVAAFLAESR